MKSKHKAVWCGILCMVFLLAACSMGITKIYENQQMNVFMQKEDGETSLSVYVTLPPNTQNLSQSALNELTRDGPQKDFEVQLSDGIYYTYQDATMDEGARMYIRVFERIAEIEEAIEWNLMQSYATVYPQEKNNFFVSYDAIEKSVSIHAAKCPGGDDLTVTWNAFLTFGSEQNGKQIISIPGITEKVQHETYTTQQHVTAELFWDEDTGIASVFVLKENACYVWELVGDLNQESVRAFADTLEHSD